MKLSLAMASLNGSESTYYTVYFFSSFDCFVDVKLSYILHC